MLGLDQLLDVCASPLWAQRVLTGGPFHDVDALLDHADRVLAELPETEIDAALQGHPRIGGRVDNASSAARTSRYGRRRRRTAGQLAAKNRMYEDKFGYVYLVCASGRSAEELLAILTDRLGNDPETERHVMRTELLKINGLRLRPTEAAERVGHHPWQDAVRQGREPGGQDIPRRAPS
jgi:2-oxo-4-hydroxy-4-carboxy-5-ureidoimidazoline decarboxylase